MQRRVSIKYYTAIITVLIDWLTDWLDRVLHRISNISDMKRRNKNVNKVLLHINILYRNVPILSHEEAEIVSKLTLLGSCALWNLHISGQKEEYYYLFVSWGLRVDPHEDTTIIGEGVQIVTYTRHLWPLSNMSL